ncbi:MAG TPA: NADPH-dependent FMN reductase, partial [Acidimicrobiales bacterium]
MRIVGVSGSLRTGSSNTALVEAAVGLAPPGVGVDVLTGIADLPAFNPDHDTDPPPGPVAALRARLAAADAVIVSSPEYAHGVPGALKNALDWLVSSGELYGTPVGVVDTTAGGHAHRSLLETLRVMGAVPVEGAVVAVPRLRTRVDAGGRLDDAEAA